MQESYEHIKGYVDRYSSDLDRSNQRQLLDWFWDRYCTKRRKFLGLGFRLQDEEAKALWGSLDRQLRHKGEV